MSLNVYLIKECSCGECEQEVYWANITHNLNRMASEAGIHDPIWSPEDVNIIKASQLIEPLTNGLQRLKAEPERYRQFNDPGGWGLYEHFVPWVEKYLEACKEHPEAIIQVSR